VVLLDSAGNACLMPKGSILMKSWHQRTVFILTLWLSLPAVTVAQPLPVKTVEFESPSVGRKMKYNIVLPEHYAESKQRYPVLYLLHGLTGNYTNWAGMGVPDYARRHGFIVVMPDVGNSWYVNWTQSESDQRNRWEDVIVKDLIGHIDASYRTIAQREGRAINGLSMGGYGSLMLGLRHPDLFCSAGSHSGAVAFAHGYAERLRTGKGPKLSGKEPSTKPDPRIGIEGFSSQAERTPKGKLFVKPEDAESYDPFVLVLKVPREKLPHLCIDCGTEDRLLESNRSFVKLLMENKIGFVYGESAGGHNSAYWRREVAVSIAIQESILQRNLVKQERSKAAAAASK
jgi:putative tributyrin esterase